MTPCADIKDLLSEYIDGALDDDAALRVEDHLDSCPACREELSALRAVAESLGDLERVSPPEDFITQLHGRMDSRTLFGRLSRALFSPERFKLPVGIVSAAAVGVVLFFIVKPQQQALKPVTLPAPAIVTDEIQKSSGHAVGKQKQEPVAKGADAPADVLPGKIGATLDKTQAPFEIEIRVKSPQADSESLFDNEAITKEQKRTAPSETAVPRRLKFKVPAAGQDIAMESRAKPEEKTGAAGKLDSGSMDRQDEESRVIDVIKASGAIIVETEVHDGKKTLFCQIPRDSLESLKKNLEDTGAGVVFPEQPLHPEGDSIIIKIRIRFKD